MSTAKSDTWQDDDIIVRRDGGKGNGLSLTIEKDAGGRHGVSILGQRSW